jgi:hypothetical protein
MSDVVIKAENIGKMYVIGHQAERGGYTAFRDVLVQNARNLWNKTKDLATGKAIVQGDTIFQQISRPESMCMVLGFQQLLGQSLLTVFPEIWSCDGSA